MREETFLAALQLEPEDETTWLALADWLEEDGQAERAELVRLVRRLRLLPLLGQPDKRDVMQARVAKLLSAGVRSVVPEVVNSIGMRFVLIPPGCFLMGSPEHEEGRYLSEGPQHEVEITKAFYLGVVPVTQAQWRAVLGNNPSFFCAGGEGKDKVAGMNTDDFPVEQVSWEDAQDFLKQLSALPEEKDKGLKYRLPSEAEWECSCRSVSLSSIFYFGNSLSSRQANFNGRLSYGGATKGPSLRRTCQVGSYPPNAFGLNDTHGNVWEWCEDWYDEGYYQVSPRCNPPGPSQGSFRVLRGGSWGSRGRNCRSADRGWDSPWARYNYVGFRAAAVLSEK